MGSEDLLAILPLLIVVGWATLLLLIDLFIPARRKGWTALLAAAGLLAALVPAVGQLNLQQQAFGGMLAVDGFAAFLQVVFLLAGVIGIALAHDYLIRMDLLRGEFYSLLLFSISGMMLMATAADLIVVFVALELLSIPLYVLSGFASPKFESQEAAMKYFLLGAFASGFLVYGIALVFGASETTNMAAIMTAMQEGTVDQSLVLIGAGMLLVGLGFKIAAVPFHMWTPDVYHGAPSPVVGFMSVGAKAGGFAALLRVFIAAFPAMAEAWGPIAMWLAAATMTWGNVAAIAQRNIKRMLAYSSIAHAGYILMALPAAANPDLAGEAVGSALFYLLAYAVTNLGAWGIVVALERQEGQGLEIQDYAGLATRRPGLALAMLLFMLSLTGLPPSAGFVGKFYLFRTVLQADLIWLALVGVITSLVSAYYYLRIVIVMYMQEGEPESRSEFWLNGSVGLTALATFLLGILPAPLFALASRAGSLLFLP
ncbi:MAG: NADH-quinone oxidoreductase subunit N [Anaerolineales bacterium]